MVGLCKKISRRSIGALSEKARVAITARTKLYTTMKNTGHDTFE
jgi:glutamate synthase domain-containing protein 2